MTPQHKLELAIAQAQKRGWMEGKEIIISRFDNSISQLFIENNKGDRGITFSLNDILFGTDFCELCSWNCDRENCLYYGWMDHQKALLYLNESERIDFLYKHVEGEEEVDTSLNGAAIMNEKISKSLCSCGCTIPYPHIHLVNGKTCECEKGVSQPVDVNQIEEIEKNDVAFDEYMRNKLNEIIQQVNANTKDIRDCKLNRN